MSSASTPRRRKQAERAFAIRGGRIIEYFAAAFGEGGKNCVTMGYGFVAGKLQNALDIAAGRNGLSYRRSSACAILARAICFPPTRQVSFMFMLPALLNRYFSYRLALIFVLAFRLPAGDTSTTFPLDQVHPGLKGVAYTIFTGDEVEKVDLVVLGVLHNAMGPKQDVILVQLLGEKAEHSGVVAGMSGSPVYFDGKLAGALSLKLGIFTKEAIGGVTPIQNMLDVERNAATPKRADAGASPSAVNTGSFPAASRVPLPQEFSSRTGAGVGQFLVPIETPLISAGLYPETIAQFSKELSGWGMSMVAGGNADPKPGRSQLKPGDMVGVELIRGDLSIAPGCTVTAVESDGTVLACGHPIFSFGSVSMPMTRGHVVTTLASSMASTKIMTSGATIGTLTQDRTTAIMGKLGAGPPMIPVDVELSTPSAEKNFHFEVIESPQLTPVLVALATYNGIVGSPAYGEGSTLQLNGDIELKGHTPVHLENLFAPNDMPIPAGFYVASEVQGIFGRIYSNPYERAHVERVRIKVTALAERRWSMIDNAWTEKSEVAPGRNHGGESLIAAIPRRAVHSGDPYHHSAADGPRHATAADQRRRDIGPHGRPSRRDAGYRFLVSRNSSS